MLIPPNWSFLKMFFLFFGWVVRYSLLLYEYKGKNLYPDQKSITTEKVSCSDGWDSVVIFDGAFLT